MKSIHRNTGLTIVLVFILVLISLFLPKSNVFGKENNGQAKPSITTNVVGTALTLDNFEQLSNNQQKAIQRVLYPQAFNKALITSVSSSLDQNPIVENGQQSAFTNRLDAHAFVENDQVVNSESGYFTIYPTNSGKMFVTFAEIMSTTGLTLAQLDQLHPVVHANHSQIGLQDVTLTPLTSAQGLLIQLDKVAQGQLIKQGQQLEISFADDNGNILTNLIILVKTF